jgi:DNA-binding transcriptional MerR regulator
MPSMGAEFQKRTYMTVNDLARRARIAAHVVRYYTQCGLLHPVRNARNAYREYAESDFQRLQFICRAKTIGFTLREISMILQAAEAGSAGPQVKQLVQSRSREHEKRLEDAQRLQQRIREAIAAWGDAAEPPPDPTSLRRLIEAVAFEE